MSAPALSVEAVDAFYGASQVLFGLDLEVGQGQTVALLGRNGAGKSTTFKAIAGLLPPRRGRIALGAETVSGRKPFRIARAGIGYVPEDRQVFPDHTVHDNILIGAKPGPRGDRPWTVGRIYEAFPLLVPLRDRRAGRLSGGEQQMLTVARTLIGNPDVLLLDEPSEGLAPVVVQAIAALIRTLREAGVTILLAEQNMHFCLGVATHATVIDKGRSVFRGTIAELRAQPEVVQRYLAL